MSGEAKSQVLKPSQRLMALFHLYLRWYIGRHFHGLRVAHGERFPREVSGPTIIYLNHPSWWDPLTCIMIARSFLPYAEHYAPMDEAALRRYGFFAKLGLFPVEPDTARGARQFLRASKEIVSRRNSVLWLTPEGAFTDVRRRPIHYKEGLATLLAGMESATVVPLAIEYVYWDERLPEILVNCGGALSSNDGGKCKSSEWNEVLSAAMTACQEELATLAVTRDPSHFQALVEGAAGIGTVYDLWRRMRSGMHGRRYEAEHGSIHRS
jgi:1-acyl-sn-glycerol-3-phosphate acyltransferase